MHQFPEPDRRIAAAGQGSRGVQNRAWRHGEDRQDALRFL